MRVLLLEDDAILGEGLRFHIRDELLSHHFGVFHERATWHGAAIPEASTPPVSGRARLTAVGE